MSVLEQDTIGCSQEETVVVVSSAGCTSDVDVSTRRGDSESACDSTDTDKSGSFVLLLDSDFLPGGDMYKVLQ